MSRATFCCFGFWVFCVVITVALSAWSQEKVRTLETRNSTFTDHCYFVNCTKGCESFCDEVKEMKEVSTMMIVLAVGCQVCLVFCVCCYFVQWSISLLRRSEEYRELRESAV